MKIMLALITRLLFMGVAAEELIIGGNFQAISILDDNYQGSLQTPSIYGLSTTRRESRLIGRVDGDVRSLVLAGNVLFFGGNFTGIALLFDLNIDFGGKELKYLGKYSEVAEAVNGVKSPVNALIYQSGLISAFAVGSRVSRLKSDGSWDPIEDLVFDGEIDRIISLDKRKILVLGGFDRASVGRQPFFTLDASVYSQIALLSPKPEFLDTSKTVCGDSNVVLEGITTLSIQFKEPIEVGAVELEFDGLESISIGKALIQRDGSTCTECSLTQGQYAMFRVLEEQSVTSLTLIVTPKSVGKAFIKRLKLFSNKKSIFPGITGENNPACSSFSHGENAMFVTDVKGSFSTPQQTAPLKYYTLSGSDDVRISYEIQLTENAVYLVSTTIPACGTECSSRGEVLYRVSAGTFSGEFTLDQRTTENKEVIIFSGSVRGEKPTLKIVITLKEKSSSTKISVTPLSLSLLTVASGLRGSAVIDVQQEVEKSNTKVYPNASDKVTGEIPVKPLFKDGILPSNQIRDVLLLSDNNLLIAGSFTNGVSIYSSNSGELKPIGSGLNGEVTGLAKIDKGFLAVGRFTSDNSNSKLNHITLIGNSLSTFETVEGGIDGPAFGIQATPDNANSLYIYGNFTGAITGTGDRLVSRNLIKLNELRFESTGAISGNVEELAVAEEQVYISGNLSHVFENPDPGLVAIGGAAGAKFLASAVVSAVTHKDDLYYVAGVNLTESGKNQVVSLTGNSISELFQYTGQVKVLALSGEKLLAAGNISDGAIVFDLNNKKKNLVPLSGSVSSAALWKDGIVVVEGSFNEINGVVCKNICFWDGNNWRDLAVTAGLVSSLAIHDNTLYVAAGQFTQYALEDNQASIVQGISGNVVYISAVGGRVYFGTELGDKISVYRFNQAGSHELMGNELSSKAQQSRLNGLIEVGGSLVAFGKFHLGDRIGIVHGLMLTNGKWKPYILAYSPQEADTEVIFVQSLNSVSSMLPLWAIILMSVLGVLLLIGLIVAIVMYVKRKKCDELNKSTSDNSILMAKTSSQIESDRTASIIPDHTNPNAIVPFISYDAYSSDVDARSLESQHDSDKSFFESSGPSLGALTGEAKSPSERDLIVAPFKLTEPTADSEFKGESSVHPEPQSPTLEDEQAGHGIVSMPAGLDSTLSSGTTDRSVKTLSYMSDASDLSNTFAAVSPYSLRKSSSLPGRIEIISRVSDGPDAIREISESDPNNPNEGWIAASKENSFKVVASGGFEGDLVNGELSFEKGSEIRVLDSTDDDYWLGELINPPQNAKSKRGLFPRRLVSRYNPDEIDRAANS